MHLTLVRGAPGLKDQVGSQLQVYFMEYYKVSIDRCARPWFSSRISISSFNSPNLGLEGENTPETLSYP
jgi:hypothetical protein